MVMMVAIAGAVVHATVMVVVVASGAAGVVRRGAARIKVAVVVSGTTCGAAVAIATPTTAAKQW